MIQVKAAQDLKSKKTVPKRTPSPSFFVMTTCGGHDETVSPPRKKYHLMLEITYEKGNSMNIVIFGANGATGKILTKQALDSGHTVTAVTRHPEAFPLQDPRFNVLGGDVCHLALFE